MIIGQKVSSFIARLRLGAVAAGGLAFGLLAGTGGLHAEPAAYPHKVVTLVTHSSPGGGSDVFLRELSRHLTAVMGVTFTVENVRGAAKNGATLGRSGRRPRR